VMYVGTAGTHQRIQRDINQPAMDNPLRGQTSPNNIRPLPGFASINYGENSTSSNYHSLQVNLRSNNYHGLTSQVAYTWSHAIDFAGTGDFSNVVNAYDIGADRGNSDFDRRHILGINYVYDLPFFKNASGPKRMLGGWQISGITSFSKGTPFTINSPGDPAGIGRTVRANLIGNPNNGPKTAEAYFDASAFASVPAVGSGPGATGFGNSARNVMYGAGSNQWNISLFKNFNGIPFLTKEGANLQFRAEFFNAFNHTQFSSYFTTFGAAGFGGANGARDPRILQFGLKFLF